MYSILSGSENKETHEHIPTEVGFASGSFDHNQTCVRDTNEKLYLDLFGSIKIESKSLAHPLHNVKPDFC